VASIAANAAAVDAADADDREAHIASIFSKLELAPAPDDYRRVLAVLTHLRGRSPGQG
jgi:hypothetical protein